MDSGVSGDVSEEEGVRNIVIRKVRELPTSSQCTGIVIGQVQREKSKLEVSKSCVFDTSEIETAIRHINNDARSANKRSNSHLLECPRPWRFPWWRGDDGVGGVGVPGGRGQVRHGPAAVHQLLRHGAGGGVMLLSKLTHD